MQLKLVIYFIFYVSIEQNLEKKVGILCNLCWVGVKIWNDEITKNEFFDNFIFEFDF